MESFLAENLPLLAVLLMAISSITGVALVAKRSNDTIAGMASQIINDPRTEAQLDKVYNAIPSEAHRKAIDSIREVTETALYQVSDIAERMARFIASVDGELPVEVKFLDDDSADDNTEDGA